MLSLYGSVSVQRRGRGDAISECKCTETGEGG